MIKNFIWDFDGTLFDSYPHSTEAFCRILKKHGIEFERNQVYDALKIMFGYAYEKYGLTKEQIEEFRAAAKDHDLQPYVVPYKDTEKVLKAVLNSGGKNFIYTHSSSETITYYLEKYGMLELFTECVTSDYGFAPKPAPDGVSYLIEKYGLCKNETIMIGDRELDVLSGTGAGALGCLITDGKDISDTAAEYVVKNPDELMKSFF